MKLYLNFLTSTLLYAHTTLGAKVIHLQAKDNACSTIRYPPPSVRPPPQDGYKGHNFADWTPPPSEHLYGIYHITHTSYEQWNSSLVNLRAERYPVYPSGKDFPVGSEAEIGSWSTCVDPKTVNCKDSRAITTVFGYSLPIGAQGPTDKKYTAAWIYVAAGGLDGILDNLNAVIAWGKDYNGFDYFVQYETDTNLTAENNSSGINIASRNEDGISLATYICLSSSLKQLAEELEDDELSVIVSQIRPLQHDNRREGEGPVECDTSCVNNTNFEVEERQHWLRMRSDEMQLPLKTVNARGHMYPLGSHRGGHLPWWGWMTIGLVFGIPLFGGLCIAVPVALCKGHRRRQFARSQRATQEPAQNRQGSSVIEPQMASTA